MKAQTQSPMNCQQSGTELGIDTTSQIRGFISGILALNKKKIKKNHRINGPNNFLLISIQHAFHMKSHLMGPIRGQNH